LASFDNFENRRFWRFLIIFETRALRLRIALPRALIDLSGQKNAKIVFASQAFYLAFFCAVDAPSGALPATGGSRAESAIFKVSHFLRFFIRLLGWEIGLKKSFHN
jgi:hypothetical protein